MKPQKSLFIFTLLNPKSHWKQAEMSANNETDEKSLNIYIHQTNSELTPAGGSVPYTRRAHH